MLRLHNPPAQARIIQNEREPAAEATDFVVVETDTTHRDYDARLAAWLGETEREHGFAERLPFPRRHRISTAALERDYQTVHIEAVCDAGWHFDVDLPITAQVETTAPAATDDAPPATLAKIRMMGSGARIDVIGLRLTGHADVASWLDEWLEQLGMTPISSRPRPTQHGVMGDILATKRSKDGVTVARYATVREGERTFVLVLRTPLANYRLVAHEFMLAVSSFRTSNDSGT